MELTEKELDKLIEEEQEREYYEKLEYERRQQEERQMKEMYRELERQERRR